MWGTNYVRGGPLVVLGGWSVVSILGPREAQIGGTIYNLSITNCCALFHMTENHNE